jgi:hypothetical protein
LSLYAANRFRESGHVVAMAMAQIA